MTIGAKIVSTDYNTIQKNIATVLGVGNQDVSGNADASYGYGQTVSSTQIAQYNKITFNHWNTLRTDILKVRQHQLGATAIGALLPATSYTISGVSIVTPGTYGSVISLVTTSSGSGTGATFVITKTSSDTKYSGNIAITLVNPGSGYAVNDTITIRGGLLGGVDGTNNLTLTVASMIGTISQGGIITDAMVTSLSTMASLAITNRLSYNVATFTAVDASIKTYTSMWTKNIVHTINMTFADANAKRYYFNTGGIVTIDATRTGTAKSTKDTLWTNFLTTVGVITFGRTSTVSTDGTNTAIGVLQLTTTDQTIYTKTTTTAGVAHATFWITAALDATNTNKIILKVNYDDDTSTNPGIVVTGNLASNVRLKYDNGTYIATTSYVPTITDDLFVYSQVGAAVVTATGGDQTVKFTWPVVIADPGLSVTYTVNFAEGPDPTINPTDVSSSILPETIGTVASKKYVATGLKVNTTYSVSVVVTIQDHVPSIPTVASAATWDIIPTPVITGTGAGGATGSVTFQTANPNSYAVTFVYQLSDDGTTWAAETTASPDIVATIGTWTNTIVTSTGGTSKYIKGYFKPITGAQLTKSLTTSPVQATSLPVFTPAPAITAVGGNGTVTFSVTNPKTFDISIIYETSTDGSTWAAPVTETVTASSNWSKVISGIGNSTTRWLRAKYSNASYTNSAYGTNGASGVSASSWAQLATPSQPTGAPGNGSVTFTYTFATNSGTLTTYTLWYKVSATNDTAGWNAATAQSYAIPNNTTTYTAPAVTGVGDNGTRYTKCYVTADNKVASAESLVGSVSSYGTLTAPTITAVGGNQSITFTATNPNAVAVNLYYKVSNSTSNTDWPATFSGPSAIIANGTTTFTASGLGDGIVRWGEGYVAATNYNNSSVSVNPTSTASNITFVKPSPPIWDFASSTSSTIKFNWTKPTLLENATNNAILNYDCYYSTDNVTFSGPFTVPATDGGATTYSITGLSSGATRYFYIIAKAQPGYNSSVASDTVTGYTTPAQPAAPTFTEPGQFHLKVNWSAAAGASKYNVYASTTSATTGFTVVTQNTTATSVTYTGSTNFAVAEGNTYWFYIQAVNDAGSAPSSTTVGTVASQTLPSASTTDIAIQTTKSSVITWPGDYAYWKFTSLYGNGAYTFTMTSTTSPAGLTSNLALYDSGGGYITGGSTNTFSRSTMTENSAFKLKSSGANSTTGSYDLLVSVASPSSVTSISVPNEVGAITLTSVKFQFTIPSMVFSSINAIVTYNGTDYSTSATTTPIVVSIPGGSKTITNATAQIRVSNPAGTAQSGLLTIAQTTGVTSPTITGLNSTNTTSFVVNCTIPTTNYYNVWYNVVYTYAGGTITKDISSGTATIDGIAAGTTSTTSLVITSGNMFGKTDVTVPIASYTPTAVTSASITAVGYQTFTVGYTAGTNVVTYAVTAGSLTANTISSSSAVFTSVPNTTVVSSVSIVSKNFFGTATTTLSSSFPVPLAVTGVSISNITSTSATINYTPGSGTNYNSGQFVTVTFTLSGGGTSLYTLYSTSASGTSLTVTIPANADSSTVPTITAFNMFSSATAVAMSNATLADVGTITTSNISTSRITYSWAAVTNATKYKVTINTSVKTPVTTTSYDMSTGLAANTKYTIKLKAAALFYNDSVTEVTKDEYTLADPPGAISIGTVTSSSIAFTFGASATRTSYNVYKDNVLLSAYTGVTGTSVTAGSLSPNTQYTFKVSALNGATPAVENFNTALSQYTLIAGTPSVTSSNVTSTSATVNWTMSDSNAGVGVTSFTVNYGAKTKTGIAADQRSYDLPSADLTPGSTYSVTVVAICAGGSVSSAAGSVAIPLPTPVITASTGYIQQVSFTWGGVTGAASYDVSFNGGTAVNQTTTSFTKTGLSDKQNYTISVIAKPTSGNPSLAGTSNATTYDKGTDFTYTTAARSGIDKTIAFTWTNVSGATSYSNNLYLTSDSSLVENKTISPGTTTTTYTTKALSSNVKYTAVTLAIDDTNKKYYAASTIVYSAAYKASISFSNIKWTGCTVTITGDGNSATTYNLYSETALGSVLQSGVAAGDYTASSLSLGANSLRVDAVNSTTGTTWPAVSTTGTSTVVTIPGKYSGITVIANVGLGGTGAAVHGNGGVGGDTLVLTTASTTSASSFLDFRLYGGGGAPTSQGGVATTGSFNYAITPAPVAATFYMGSNGGNSGTSSAGGGGGGAVNTTIAGGNGGTTSPGGKGALGKVFGPTVNNVVVCPFAAGVAGTGGTSSSYAGVDGTGLSGGGGAYGTTQIAGQGAKGGQPSGTAIPVGAGGGGGGSTGVAYGGAGGNGAVYIKWTLVDGTTSSTVMTPTYVLYTNSAGVASAPVTVTDPTNISVTAASDVTKVEIWAVAAGGGGGNIDVNNKSGGGGAGGAAAYAVLA